MSSFVPPHSPAGITPGADETSDHGFVRVLDASEHNLRHIDLIAPRHAFVAFTGVSGSGKSSLAFGTIYAEAQRRYLESVAPYARRLIQQVGAPHVGDITGLPMAIALEQRRGTPSSRSTVGTMTRLSNSLRLLFSRAGTYPAGTVERLDSDSFTPSTSAGACPTCQGLGRLHTVTEESLVRDPSLTIREGAVTAWPGAWQGKNYRDILIELGYDIDVPWNRLPRSTRDWILFTDEHPTVTVHPESRTSGVTYQGTFASAKAYVLHTYATTGSDRMRARAAGFLVFRRCPDCRGTGITPAALRVTFAGRSIDQLAEMPLDELDELLAPTAALEHPAAAISAPDSGELTEVAVRIVRDLRERIAVVAGLGLAYLSIDRTAPTLSSGELQRLRLAAQLRSGLFGVLYVLDEPSSGLHPRDGERMIRALRDLVAQGNSLFVVEHDMAVVAEADWIVDVGPGAGSGGGEIVYSGPVAGLREVTASETRPYLFPDLRVPVASHDRVADGPSPEGPRGVLRLHDIHRRNLDGVDVDIPLGALTAVTGVSGSGKSTLAADVLPRALLAWFSRDADHTGALDLELEGSGESVGPEPGDASAPTPDEPSGRVRISVEGALSRVIRVDQQPIGRTPRSTIATYSGVFDLIRARFAQTDEARRRGWDASRFSYNTPAGRCPTCEGQGVVSVELLFLPGSTAPCPTCHGARYTDDTLEVRWRGRTIAEVLGMTVSDAVGQFDDDPPIDAIVRTLAQVGLGYARLGQSATELSGGEAQRVKLAAELRRAGRRDTVYVLDEPTTGLHPADVEMLATQLQRMVDAGSTVVVVEHQLDLIRQADWIIDLGPGSGARGGRVVSAGSPAHIAGDPASVTGPYL